MSMDEWEAREQDYLDQLYNEFGPEWAAEHYDELHREHYEEAIREFTAERLQSYYVTHPNVAAPANESLRYAESLAASHPRAALVFAATAMELAIKLVLLKPIVFGFVHTEGIAGFITDLTTQHTGMERSRRLLTEILAHLGGVDLKTFRGTVSTNTLWQEIEEVQKARNAVIHRGEDVSDEAANLAVAVASTLLKKVFPQVLAKLGLHLHDPGVVCGETHGVPVSVHFPIPGHVPSISGPVVLHLDTLDCDKPPDSISGSLGAGFPTEDVLALRSADPCVRMWITSTLVQYEVHFRPESNEFTGTRVSSSPARDGG